MVYECRALLAYVHMREFAYVCLDVRFAYFLQMKPLVCVFTPSNHHLSVGSTLSVLVAGAGNGCTPGTYYTGSTCAAVPAGMCYL